MTDTKLQIRIGEEKKALWKDKAEEMGVSMTEMIKGAVDGLVMTGKKESVMTDKVVMTENIPKVESSDIRPEEVTLEDLQEEVEEAVQIGEKENWERVRVLLSKAGYEWDARQRAILEDGRVVYRPSNR